ncbi:hypothetical protein Q9R08_09790 [Microbacterium sp. QXD-8]|uniref:Uncharacterized protein n=1 Tax=Microbacterium psychrotolerans TaxID=3068321 RepID=A0ABU0Z101_9MICO|nr:hypothetical protein [Microbacterium sp. QXD-8]MDQ7878262.1 hypothetical protein [Microbacterium sp. QXD-8]
MAGGGEGAASAGPVRPPIALAFATIGFVALTIFGLGMTSLILAEDVIATPGLGQIPGAAGVVCATLAFAGGLWAAIARAGSGPPGGSAAARHPSYWGAAWTTAAAFLAYVGGVWFAALFTGADLGVATAVAGRLATSWFGVSVAAAAFVSAWAGIALVRTRAHRPRWPWEDDYDE